LLSTEKNNYLNTVFDSKHGINYMTSDILDLVEWIKSNNCEAVAMESTGVYWKPIYNLLEVENIKTLVVNAKLTK